ncbi:MAG: carboxypeptidase regulatory-like domain-containing protein [Bacteroidia bacterium]
MKWLIWISATLLWAQVESRNRASEPPPKPAPKPTPVAQPVVVELPYVTISGKVIDPNEDAVPGAQVQVLSQNGKTVLAESETDKQGRFGIAIPKTNQVILRISKDGKVQEKTYTLEELQSDDLEIKFLPD